MAKLVASIDEECNGCMIELRLGHKVIETLYIDEPAYGKKKFEVCRVIQENGSLCDIHRLVYIDPYDEEKQSRVVADNELDNTDIIRIKSHTDILFKGTEKQCIRYAKKWLENEYSTK